MKSMTGYGRGECTLYDRKFVVEIKSVNHRYNDITIKLPRVMNSFEDKLRKEISQFVKRGKTDVYISFESYSKDDVKIVVNEALTDAYIESLSKLKEKYSLKDELSLYIITRFPDVLNIERKIDDEKAIVELWEALCLACNQALKQLIKMRSIEGEILKKDILSKLAQISQWVQIIEGRAPLVALEYSEKLQVRLKEAIETYNIDEARLLAEITLFADKACIDEELARLKSHIFQMDDILKQQQPIGRKLDFLVQEINREINTIGSKCNDIEVTKIVVDLKSEVEKIREQVQNIE